MNHLLLTLALLAADPAVADVAAEATPAPNAPENLDFSVKNARASKVFAQLGTVAGKTIVADCLGETKISVSYKNIPVSVLLDALAARLGVTYAPGESGSMQVVCPNPKKDPSAEWGGVRLSALTLPLASYLGIAEAEPVGAMLRTVPVGTPASTAQLQEGDVVLEADGAKVVSPEALEKAARKKRGDLQMMDLKVLRDRQTYRLTVVLKAEKTDPLVVQRMLHQRMFQAPPTGNEQLPTLWSAPGLPR